MIALMSMLLMTALGTALVLTTTSETMIAANFRTAARRCTPPTRASSGSMDDLLTVPDWNKLLDRLAAVGVHRRPPSGDAHASDGSTIDLDAGPRAWRTARQVDDVQRRRHGCHDATSARGRPTTRAGSSSPTARSSDLLPTGTINSPFYVVVLVGDDPSETDDDPIGIGGTRRMAARRERNPAAA